jgi:hypothetical protein
MKDIRISTEFFHHPKIQKLKRRRGPAGILALLQLYAEIAKHRPDGDISSLDQEWISIATDLPENKVDQFLEDLVSLKLLDRENGTLKIHDWEVHNPWIKFSIHRSEIARNAALARWSSKQSMHNACDPHASCNAIRMRIQREEKESTLSNTLYIGKSNSESKPLANSHFEQFFSAYPKQEDRYLAEQEWCELTESIPPDQLLQRCLTSLEWQRTMAKWTDQDGRYIPSANQYLKRRKFDDKPVPAAERKTQSDDFDDRLRKALKK